MFKALTSICLSLSFTPMWISILFPHHDWTEVAIQVRILILNDFHSSWPFLWNPRHCWDLFFFFFNLVYRVPARISNVCPFCFHFTACLCDLVLIQITPGFPMSVPFACILLPAFVIWSWFRLPYRYNFHFSDWLSVPVEQCSFKLCMNFQTMGSNEILEPSIPSEVSQEEKHKYCILTHIYGTQKDGNDDPTCKAAKRHRCKEQTCGLCGRRRGWDDLRD